MDNQEKVYVGGAKEKTGNYGVFHSISFSAQDLETLKQNLNEKGYINLNMNQRQTPSQYGQTHSLTIDFWRPQPQGQAPQQLGQQPQMQQPAFQKGAPIPQEFQQPSQANQPYQAPPQAQAQAPQSNMSQANQPQFQQQAPPQQPYQQG